VFDLRLQNQRLALRLLSAGEATSWTLCLSIDIRNGATHHRGRGEQSIAVHLEEELARVFFFLEYAKDLRIIVLRRRV